MRVWEVGSGVCISILTAPTATDKNAIEPGGRWRAVCRGLETVIEEARSGREVAWFGEALRLITKHPTEPLWLAATIGQVVLIRLEGY
jgi:hypothetical protein